MQPTLLSGRYRVISVLKPLMEVTYYAAEDTSTNQTITVRVIDTSQAGQVGTGLEHLSADKLRRKMDNEIKLLSTLRHAGLLDLLDHGFDAPYYYHIYPAHPFETLKDHIDRQGRLSPSDALRAIDGAAVALATLHQHGLTHGDIIAEHILWDGAQAKLIEFAIANYEAEDSSIPGTPAYLSPEAITGATPAPPRDVWSLGVALSYAVSGRLPFGEAHPSQVPALFGHILQAPPNLADDFPAGVRDLIIAMLDKNPATRLTLTAVQTALRRLIRDFV